MKTKNLLLAGFVAVAMSACSNSEDFVDNGQPTGEKATMQLQLSFPDGTTRGTSTPTDGDKNAGSDLELNTANISVLLAYGESNQVVVVPKIKVKNTAASNTVTTEKFIVTAGKNVKVYAFINPSDPTLTGINLRNIDSKTIGAAIDDKVLDYLAKSVAKDDNFMMSTVTPNIVTITAGSDANTATVSVDRVVAKLDETTGKKKFNLKETQTAIEDEITVELVNHTFDNLNKESYLLGQATSYAGDFFQPYSSTGIKDNFKWKPNDVVTGTEQEASAVTYCYENINGNAFVANTSNHTSVIYEGQVYLISDQGYAAKTFYTVKALKDGIVKTVICKSWEKLGEYVDLTDITEGADGYRAELTKLGVKSYINGKCYYFAPITHVGKGATVIRNNWYKLNVSKITDLGEEDPNIPTENNTKLTLSVTVNPWTIHINNIEL